MDAVEGVCLGKVRYAGMKRLDYWIDFDPSGLVKYEKSGLHGCKASPIDLLLRNGDALQTLTDTSE